MSMKSQWCSHILACAGLREGGTVGPAEVLRAAALAEAQPEHPRHAAAVWLAALLWLEDARWRKLRSGGAPTDALEALLDALSRRVLLLSLPAPEDTAPIRPVATAPGSSGQTKPPCMDAGTPGHEVLSLRQQSAGGCHPFPRLCICLMLHAAR